MKRPYLQAGVSLARYPHRLGASIGKQLLHTLTAGLFGAKSSNLVQSVATAAWKDSHNPIVLVGHSWGGASAYWLTGTFAQYSGPDSRRIIVTLDPVSFNHSPFNPNPIEQIFRITEQLFGVERIPHPGETLVYLKHGPNGKLLSDQEARGRIAWLHIFATPTNLDCGNNIAQLGGWWGSRGNADLKLQANTSNLWPDWYKKYGEDTGHCEVIPMYYTAQDFLIREIKKTCGLDLPKAELSVRDGKATLVFTP